MARHRPTRHLVRLLAGFAGLVAVLAVVAPMGGAPVAAGAAPEREVHIAYYAWYGNPTTDGAWDHWTHAVLDGYNVPTGELAVAPDDIGANFWPEAGLYSSNDPATIDRQMAEIAGAGVDVVAVSWWGPGASGDGALPAVLDAAAAHGLEVTVIIEPSFSSASQVRSWIVYLIDTYGAHPAFYRSAFHGERPMFYTFQPLKLDLATLTFAVPPEEWAEVLTPGGAETIRGTAHDAAIVAHVEVSPFVDQVAAAGFDAVNNYFASGSVTIPGTTEGLTVSGDTTTWPDLLGRAQEHGIEFYPSVGPGYRDLRIRPENVAATRDRANGAYYADMVDAACRTDADIISITSYNEWHEGTQIEPTVAHTTPVTSYPGFEGGPDQYLDQTREWVAAFKAGTLCPPVTDPPVASSALDATPVAAAVVTPVFTG